MPSAVDSLLAIAHIVKRIIDYAERPTLARLMRVSKRLYMMAARPLYHTGRRLRGDHQLPC